MCFLYLTEALPYIGRSVGGYSNIIAEGCDIKKIAKHRPILLKQKRSFSLSNTHSSFINNAQPISLLQLSGKFPIMLSFIIIIVHI